MYDDEFELTFNLSDEDPAPVEVPKAPAEEAEPEKPEPPTPAPDEEPTIVVPELGRKHYGPIARELGINFKQGYKGDLTSRHNGYIGG